MQSFFFFRLLFLLVALPGKCDFGMVSWGDFRHLWGETRIILLSFGVVRGQNATRLPLAEFGADCD